MEKGDSDRECSTVFKILNMKYFYILCWWKAASITYLFFKFIVISAHVCR